jgi:hypothetical protein
VLALDRELDDLTVDDIADRDAQRDLRTPSFERSVSTKRLAGRARKGGDGDLEAAHRAAAILAVGHGLDAVARRQRDDLGSRGTQLGVEGGSRGVGDVAIRILRLELIVDESVERVLIAQLLEEILLTPALEHPVRDLDRGQSVRPLDAETTRWPSGITARSHSVDVAFASGPV